MKIEAENLKSLGWVTHGFFTPKGDAAARAMGGKLYLCRQVHGTAVAQAPHAGCEADAQITDKAGVAIGVITADCAPVLLAARDRKIVAAVHAGWRGALAGIAGGAVAALESRGARASEIVAAIGPCIGPRSYETGEEVRSAFLQKSAENAAFFTPSGRGGHYMFDLAAFVARDLARAGVKDVSVSGVDTFADASFHSYRRATLRGEPADGRQISAIVISSQA